MMHEDFKNEDWKNELKKLLGFDELRSFLVKFEETDFSSSGVEEIERVYFEKINLYPGLQQKMNSSTINSFKFFRVRTNIDLTIQSEALISTFSYPSPVFCDKNGRANLAKYPVFYCSDDMKTAFDETQPQPGDVVYISEWSVNCDRDAFFCPILTNNVADKNTWKIYSDEMFLKIKKWANEAGNYKEEEIVLLYDTFSNWFKSESKPYSKSSWISNKNLYKTNRIDFIVYPSFAMNQETCNMAFHPNFVDNFFRLEKVLAFQHNQAEDGKKEVSNPWFGKPDLTNINWSPPKSNEELSEFFEGIR